MARSPCHRCWSYAPPTNPRRLPTIPTQDASSQGDAMRIEPGALAKAIGALDAIDLDRGLAPSVLQLAAMTKQLLGVDGVGLMLVDAEGALRWAAASDQQAEQ